MQVDIGRDIATALAQRLYPVRYEIGRLTRVALAGLGAVLIARTLPALPPLAGFLARGAVTAAVYLGLLWATGFFRSTERAFIRELVTRLRKTT